MSGHTYIHTYIHIYIQDNYSNPRCVHARRGLNIYMKECYVPLFGILCAPDIVQVFAIVYKFII